LPEIAGHGRWRIACAWQTLGATQRQRKYRPESDIVRVRIIQP
jgi:hypothetical protein